MRSSDWSSDVCASDLVSITDLQELTDLRCDIESIASRRSVERGGIEWEGGLVAAQYTLRATSARFTEDGEVSLEFLAAPASFHRALAAPAGNHPPLVIQSQLYAQSTPLLAFYYHLA